jgi:hypothetical protein
MEYVTRQLAIIRKQILDTLQTLHQSNKQIAEAIHAAQERRKKQNEIWEEHLENVLTKYDKAESNRASNDGRHYDVQKSIRNATWCAVFAASVYGYISYRQWDTAKETLEAETRPWVSPVEGSIRNITTLVAGDSTEYNMESVSFNLELRNYGISPATIGRVQFKLVAMPNFLQENIRTNWAAVCNAAEKELTDPAKSLETIFPGKDGVIDWLAVAMNHPSNEKSTVTPESRAWNAVVACTAYPGPTGIIHHTKFAYRVVYSDQLKISEMGNVPYRDVIDLKRLYVTTD